MMSRAIVTYFSVTGVTADVAHTLADVLGADILEIKAEAPSSGSDAAKVPDPDRSGITCKKQDLDGYDTIFVGLPIWWYAAPTVINSFLDDYDLTGKTIVPFATSGGGGIDRVKSRLESSCSGADLHEATLLTGELTRDELARWAAPFLK